MKCKILHESKGRLRVHLFCGKMSLDNADVLEYYLRAVNGVTDVSVYDRTCDAVIVFTERKAAAYCCTCEAENKKLQQYTRRRYCCNFYIGISM